MIDNINELAVHVRNTALFTDMQKTDAEVKSVLEAKAKYNHSQASLVALMAASHAGNDERQAVQDTFQVPPPGEKQKRALELIGQIKM